MGEHLKHLAPVRRRERKTVHEDSRWKPDFIVSAEAEKRNGKTSKEQRDIYDAL